MPSPLLPDDVSAALGRLEAGGPDVANPRRMAAEPTSHLDAVRQWVTARGWKPGRHATPSLAALAGLLARFAQEAGWAWDGVPPRELSRCLKALGFVPYFTGGRRGFRVDADTARALALAAPTPKRRLKQPHPRRRPAATRRVTPPFWPLPPRARPLVDTLGRVWPSARVAAAALPRVNHQDIQAAAKGRRAGVGGCLWRYLSPAEVARVPPMHLAGHVLQALAWRGTVSAHDAAGLDACPACGARRLADAPTPSPQASPGPPASMGPAGGPTHIPAPNSDW